MKQGSLLGVEGRYLWISYIVQGVYPEWPWRFLPTLRFYGSTTCHCFLQVSKRPNTCNRRYLISSVFSVFPLYFLSQTIIGFSLSFFSVFSVFPLYSLPQTFTVFPPPLSNHHSLSFPFFLLSFHIGTAGSPQL